MNKFHISLIGLCMSLVGLLVTMPATASVIAYGAQAARCDYAEASAKFDAQLAHALSTGSSVESLSAGLRRMGHGFIQVRADDYEGFAPLPS